MEIIDLTDDITEVIDLTADASEETAPPLRNVESRFLELRAELRNRIYDMVLIQEQGTSIRVTDKGFKRPGLLSTCRQIRKETLQIFYYGNEFCIPTPGYKADVLHAFVSHLRQIGLKLKKTDKNFRELETRRQPS